MGFENVALEHMEYEPRSYLPADEFVFGAPATRFQIVGHEIVSFFELFRISRPEDAEPLGLTLVKLAALVVFATAAATAVMYSVGAIVARSFSSFVG